MKIQAINTNQISKVFLQTNQHKITAIGVWNTSRTAGKAIIPEKWQIKNV